MDKIGKMNRRKFLVSTATFGGGLALSLTFGGTKALAASSADTSAADDSIEFSPWVAITADDQVIVRVTHTEIGNGAITQVAMNVTEELGCDWNKVTTEQASIQRDYKSGNKAYSIGFQPWFGGHSTNSDRMKYAFQVGASMRERLKAAAAARWGVSAAEIEVNNGVLKHSASGRSLRFGEVAAEAANIQLTAEPELKDRSQWSFIGKHKPAKLHLPEVVNGTATYGIDVKLPGMVHAAVKQSPVHGGKLKSYDASAVLNMSGVHKVVVLDESKTVGTPVKQESTFGLRMTETLSGVAVIADHYWQAKKALDALPIEWDAGDGAQWQNIDQAYTASREEIKNGKGRTVKSAGDVSSVEPAQTVSADYGTPFCEHMAMEPINGTAIYNADKLEIWCSTQDVKQAYWVAIDESGLHPEQVTINPTLVGGGFGRRTASAEIRTVVSIAREMPGVPVKLIMSREESTQQGRYRIMAQSHLQAGLDDKGMPVSLEGGVCFAGANMISFPFGFSDAPYVASGGIANVKLSQHALPMHLGTGAYRAPCYNANAFFMETFIDECAAAANIDPLDYRLQLINPEWDSSWQRCLKLAAEKIGWGKSLPKGEGLGIAVSNWPMSGIPNMGTTLATAVHVAVTPQGQLKVKRVEVAFDCGSIANSNAVAAQIEGSIIFGMNMTLNEEITLRDGAVVETNFHQYPMVKMADCPEINVHFDALSNHQRFDIIGEVGVGPIGPAIGNAIYQATGKRLRTTPFRKQDLSWS